jgi:hypothetical protein
MVSGELNAVVGESGDCIAVMSGEGNQNRSPTDSVRFAVWDATSNSEVGVRSLTWAEIFGDSDEAALSAAFRGVWISTSNNAVELCVVFLVPDMSSDPNASHIVSTLLSQNQSQSTSINKISPIETKHITPKLQGMMSGESSHVLWVHVMDGIGFPHKNKSNFSVLFELLIEHTVPSQGTSVSSSEVIASTESARSTHSRHLLWDQFLEILIPGTVSLATLKESGRLRISVWLNDVYKVRSRPSSPVHTSTNPRQLRPCSPFGENSDGQVGANRGPSSPSLFDASANKSLEAMVEKNVSDILQPFFASDKISNGVFATVDRPDLRHEVVVSLLLSTEHNLEHDTGVLPDVRVRLGFLLLPFVGTVNRQTTSSVASANESIIHNFMSKKGE